MTTLTIADDVAEMFPHLCLGLVAFSDLDNRGESAELEALQRRVAEETRTRVPREALADVAEVAAWRRAYTAFGAKPKKTMPTLEAMLLRLIKDKPFPGISLVVDAYLIVQTRHLLPIGGYDRDHLQGDIVLRRSEGGEAFRPLGAAADEETRPGEIIYADDARVLTRNWNYRDSDATKITRDSRNVLLCMEAVAEEGAAQRVAAAIAELAELVTRFCGGSAKSYLCDLAKGERSVAFD